MSVFSLRVEFYEEFYKDKTYYTFDFVVDVSDSSDGFNGYVVLASTPIRDKADISVAPSVIASNRLARYHIEKFYEFNRQPGDRLGDLSVSHFGSDEAEAFYHKCIPNDDVFEAETDIEEIAYRIVDIWDKREFIGELIGEMKQVLSHTG